MSRDTALRAFMVGAPLAFAALLTQHPNGGQTFYDGVAGNVTPWLAVHYGAAAFFPLMALVVWWLVRGLSGRAATITRVALPVYAVGYGVYEAVIGIANGLVADAGNGLSGAEQRGAEAAFDAIVGSPLVGEPGLFVSVGSLAWWTAISAAIMALKHAGAGRAPLVLLALGGMMTFHVPIGPPALACLAAAVYLIERSAVPARRLRPSPTVA